MSKRPSGKARGAVQDQPQPDEQPNATTPAMRHLLLPGAITADMIASVAAQFLFHRPDLDKDAAAREAYDIFLACEKECCRRTSTHRETKDLPTGGATKPDELISAADALKNVTGQLNLSRAKKILEERLQFIPEPEFSRQMFHDDPVQEDGVTLACRLLKANLRDRRSTFSNAAVELLKALLRTAVPPKKDGREVRAVRLLEKVPRRKDLSMPSGSASQK